MTAMLREWSSYQDSKIVLEYKENNGTKECYMKGILCQANTRNLNERIYPLHEIAKAVEEMRQRIGSGQSVLCECDHPDTLSINLDRVAGMITDIWMDGTNAMGVIKILPTTNGNDIRAMLESGVRLGVSSRGSGNVVHNGYVSDFEMVTVDIVAQPSAPNAYPNAVFESYFNKYGRVLGESDSRAGIITTSTDINTVRGNSMEMQQQIFEFFKNLRA